MSSPNSLTVPDDRDTFSSMAKMATIRLFLIMVAMRRWTLYPLITKSDCLHGNLAEEVYIEQPPDFVV